MVPWLLFLEHSLVNLARRQTKLHDLVYGLNWLEKRPKGIPIFTVVLFCSTHPPETFKVEVYVYDVKPAITSLAELELVD